MSIDERALNYAYSIKGDMGLPSEDYEPLTAAYSEGFTDGFEHAKFLVSEFWTILTSPKFCADHSEMLKIDGYFRLLRAHMNEDK